MSVEICEVAQLAAILRFCATTPIFPCLRHPLIDERTGKTRNPKSPHIARGFLEASRDQDMVNGWWRRWPDALAGVPTGEATGLLVIDVDVKRLSDAAKWWIDEHQGLLVETLCHHTVSDGRHYLFRIPKGHRYTCGKDVELDGAKRVGIDIRADGGYVIWWPLHGLMRVNDKAIPLPVGLLETRVQSKLDVKEFPASDSDKWLQDRELTLDALKFIDPSDRDAWIMAGQAIHFASGGSQSGFTVWHEFSRGALNDTLPANYGGEADCRYTWSSFGRQEGRAQRTLGTLLQAAETLGWEAPKTLKANVWRAQLPPEKKRKLKVSIADLNFVSLQSVLSTPLQPKIPLVDGLLYPGAWLLVGRPKIGKSWLQLQLALAIAEGSTFLGMKCHAANVLLLCVEDDAARVKSRLQALGCARVPEDCYVVTNVEFKALAQLYAVSCSFCEFLEAWLIAHPHVRFVVVDTEIGVRQIWGGEGAEDNGRVVEGDYKQTNAYDTLALKLGVAIVLVNHAKKKNGEHVGDVHELINRSNTALAGASGSIVLADMPNADPFDTSNKTRVLGFRGRDIRDDVLLAVEQNEDLPYFENKGTYEQVRQSQAQEEALFGLEHLMKGVSDDSYVSAADIADHIGGSRAAVKRTLGRMLSKNFSLWKGYRVGSKSGKNGGFRLDKV
jgi:hypothetical protein